MKIKQLHDWEISTQQAIAVQRSLAGQIFREGEIISPGLVAGADISVSKDGFARAAVVVLRYPEMALVEIKAAEGRPSFPYIPGLLSFRESPLVLAAWEKLGTTPDLLLVDGQGIAHPRRMGLACHLGLLLDTASIGCAKSMLCGRYQDLGETRGSWAELVDRGEVVGAALRTRDGGTPVYVSIGHKISLSSAIDWVLRCCSGHRLPEPSRLAHLAAGGKL